MCQLTKETTIHRAKNLQEVQYILKNVSEISPIAGATGFLHNQHDNILTLPKHVLDLNGVKELKSITKTERYFEFASLVTLNSILDLGRRNISHILYDAIEKVGNHTLRNLATIGGNIAKADPASGLFLPMLALDAKLEIKTAKDSEWVPFARYIDKSFDEKRKRKFVISRIRIPNETWSSSTFTRIGHEGYIDESSASFLFSIRLNKNILSEMRLLFASKNLIREKEFDNLLLGRTLPLAGKEVSLIMQKTGEIFTRDKFDSDYHYKVFLNLLEDNLYKLS